MNINGWFIFGGMDTRSLGVDVARGDILNRPFREFQVTTAPGRLGDIVQDNQRYPNVEISYWVMIPDNFDAVYRQLRGMLVGVTGYARLEDAWNTDEFYQAYVSAPLQPTVSHNRRQGTVLVTFSRQPERWLKRGETAITPDAPTSTRFLASDIPSSYAFFPRIRLQYSQAISDTSWKLRYPFMQVDYAVHNSSYVGVQFLLYKSNQSSWADYLTVGDRVTVDMATGEIVNETQNMDLSGLASRDILDGILPPSGYAAGADKIYIRVYSFELIDITPRWYTI